MSQAVRGVRDWVGQRFTNAVVQQLNDMKRLGLSIGRNEVIVAIKDVVGRNMVFVLSHDEDVRDRVTLLDSLVGWLYVDFGARSDVGARGALEEWHYIVGNHWYATSLIILNDSIAQGGVLKYEGLPLSASEIREIVTTKAERRIIPRGRDMVAAAFDDKMRVEQFVAMIQTMVATPSSSQPPVPPSAVVTP